MKKGELLYEGKAKKVFKTDDPAHLIQQFKDDATAFDGEKKSTIAGKGVVNNTISSHLFNLLEQNGVRTHFVEKLSDREMLIKALKMVPVEVIMRNVAAGSICRRYGIEESLVFDKPILELYFKSDPHHDPLMNAEHVIQFNLCTPEVLDEMYRQARKTNAVLRDFFRTIGINLVDFKLEFGLHGLPGTPRGSAQGQGDQVLMGDEISPDTCRFWDLETGKKLDKDRFRFDLGDVSAAYQEMLTRVTAA